MPNPVLSGYDPGSFWCEMSRGGARQAVRDRLAALPLQELKRRAANADAELRDLGITFTVYSERDAIDRVLPFDCIPRVLSAEDWARIEAGVCQRVAALNHLLHDIYHEQKILKDGVIPADLVLGNANYRPIMRGVDLPHRTYVNVCGTDIVRDGSGEFLVLEDNARTPSGVCYVVENRHMMMRAFPDLLGRRRAAPGRRLRRPAAGGAARDGAAGADDPQVVLLSPGPYNSAYFEHVFLAREMGVPLVEGRDLVVGGRPGLHADHRRPRPRRGDLSPHRRRLPRPGGVPPRQRARRARPDARLSRRQGGAGQRGRHRRRRRQGGLRLHAAGDPLLPRPGPDPAQCRDPHLPRAGGAALHARPSRGAGGEAGRRVRRLRHHHRPAREPGGAGGVPGASCSPIRRTTSASPASRSRSRRPWWTAGIEPRHVDLRPFAVTGREDLGAARRADAGGAAARAR